MALKAKPVKPVTKPEFILRSGPVSLAAFRFIEKTEEGKTFDNWSFSCTRSYLNEKGEYDHSTFLRASDILTAAALLQAAWQKIQVSQYIPGKGNMPL